MAANNLKMTQDILAPLKAIVSDRRPLASEVIFLLQPNIKQQQALALVELGLQMRALKAAEVVDDDGKPDLELASADYADTPARAPSWRFMQGVPAEVRRQFAL